MTVGFFALINDITYRMGDVPGYIANFKNGWQHHINAAEYGHDKSGFYGASFVNHETKELIISYSGTTCFNLGSQWSKWYNCFQDIYADVEMFLGRLPTQLSDVQSFTNETLSLIGYDNAQQYNIIVTGHSLGAIHSNLMAIDLHNKGLNVKVVNFDSPGSKPVVSTYISENNYEETIHPTTYNAPKNWINSLNYEIGEVIPLQNMPCSGGSFWYGLTSAWVCHQMSEILNSLVSNEGDYLHIHL